MTELSELFSKYRLALQFCDERQAEILFERIVTEPPTLSMWIGMRLARLYLWWLRRRHRKLPDNWTAYRPGFPEWLITQTREVWEQALGHPVTRSEAIHIIGAFLGKNIERELSLTWKESSLRTTRDE